MDEKEFIENFGMTREKYAEKYGVLEDPNLGKDKTLRQKSVDKVAGALQNLGFDQYLAYNQANRILGNYENPITEGGIGVLDFTPLQIPFAIQEAKRAFDRGDYLESALTGSFSALETLPFMKLVSTPVKSFFKSLGNKVTSETPIDLSRRKAFAPIVAAPVAVGAFSEIPVGKIMEDVMPTTKIVDDVIIEPKVAGSSLFKNMKQEAKFAADMYNAKTGKNLTPKQIVDRDMAEYLYFIEEGDGNPYMLEKATKNLKSGPVYQVLDDVGYETDDPDIMEVFKKHMGDADEYSYGSSGGDELTQKLFEEENPDKLFKNEMGNLTYNNDDLVDWIKSKGIQNTKYYKQLVKAGDAD